MSGIPPNIAAIAGPILLGYMFDWAFLAFLTIEVYTYYSSFPDDKALPKIIVYSLYCIDLTQTILLTADAWRMFAAGYGNPAELLNVGFIWLSCPTFTAIVSMVVQHFFAYRLFLLSKSRLLGLFIASVSLTQGISGIVAGSQAHAINDFSLLPTHAFKGTMVWLTGSAACDVLISGFMIYFLSSSDTGFRETRLIIRRLVRVTIETGTMTAMLATLTIIVFAVFPSSTYYTCPSLMIAKSYTISAIVIFNNRAHFRNPTPPVSNELVTSIAWARNTTTTGNQVHIPGDAATGGLRDTVSNGQIGVRVDHEQWSDAVEMSKTPGSASPEEYNANDIKLPV